MSFLNIDKVRSILDEINGMIETTLMLTRGDIAKFMSALKKMDGVNEHADAVKAIIYDLQNFDIFEQRLKHVIEINCCVLLQEADAAGDAMPGINIFRLNQLQYEAAWSD